MLPELKSTLQQLLKLPQEEADQSIADTETVEEVKGRIRHLLARASYKYVRKTRAFSAGLCRQFFPGLPAHTKRQTY